MKIKMNYKNTKMNYEFEDIIIMNNKPSKVEIQNKCVDWAKTKAVFQLDKQFQVFSKEWWDNYHDIKKWTDANKISAEVIEE